ncbi:alpha-mannosidase [Mesobacillus stamsii]|nr:alpha-mannosidase [Mesobacillus stamsii]
MFWKEQKLEARIDELSEFRYKEKISIPSFHYLVDNEGKIATPPPILTDESDMIGVGEYWTGSDVYIWLQTKIKIPDYWKEHEIVGRFNFGRTGGGNNTGFESMLFLNDSPYQGVDSNHEEVFFPSETAGTVLEMTFRLWSGLSGGGVPKQQEHKIKQAELAILDPATDDLFFTAKAVIETVKSFDKNNPDRTMLLTALDKTFRLIDWAKPGSDHFYDSISQAQSSLYSELQRFDKHHPVTLRCIGHTHIDVAWLWRLKHTREKAARSFSTVLRLMEKYPEYIFLQTQPQLYDYIKSDYPQIYEQIKKRVEEGRWEAGGGMWLEADCNVTSGESLVRQLLFGTRFLKNEFGTECTYLWLPDVFGYSWALPQILRKSGIETFMTTKISWNQYNRIPHDTFIWRGMDGSEVVAHFVTTPDRTYSGDFNLERVQGIWNEYQDKSLNQELLLTYGWGDGGGGVNREMLEMRRRLNQLPGLPKLETGRADEYFKDLKDRVDQTDQYVHTWDGELYLEYHRGTYTSQAQIKRINRKLELMYRETEWLGVLSAIFHKKWYHYPQEELQEGWKIILRNQFHDIIPGSSIREVYEDSEMEYEEAEKLGREGWTKAADAILANDDKNGYTIFNSSPWARKDLIELPVKDNEQGAWFDANGNKLKSVMIGDQWLVAIENIPAMGFAKIAFDENSTNLEIINPFVIEESEITTPYFKIAWNRKGQLTTIFDLQTNREVLSEGQKGNVFQVFEDKPMMFDAWDIDIYYQEKMREIIDLTSVQILEATALRVVVRFEWKYMDSSVKQDMILYSDSRRIDFNTDVEWHEQHQLLKVAFPVEIRSTEATYDVQFGNVKRPTHWNTSWDYARFETVGHQWADLGERGYGISLLNDCKYGYDIKDNVIRLTLIKSATDPDYLQDQGSHTFIYSLLPHKGDWLEGNTVQQAWWLNNPVTYAYGGPMESQFSLFYSNDEQIMIDAVKKSEDLDQVILRVHDFAGSRRTVEIRTDFSLKSWQECNLMEQVIGKQRDGEVVRFEIKPYEIKTFLIDLGMK